MTAHKIEINKRETTNEKPEKEEGKRSAAVECNCVAELGAAVEHSKIANFPKFSRKKNVIRLQIMLPVASIIEIRYPLEHAPERSCNFLR